eukprot:COSAG01_NODE_1356_length_10592_cov_4.971995_8_plen_71_part_00
MSHLLLPNNLEGDNGRAGSEGRPARHQPHRDNTPIPGTEGENAREITCLLYLNPTWEQGWGGQLRCHVVR